MNNNMKILHFSWDTPIPGIGGSTHEWNMAKAFKKLGHKVRLVCEWEYDKKISEDLEGIQIRRVHWRTGFRQINPLILCVKAKLNALYHIIFFSPNIIYERYRIMGGFGVLIGKLFGKKTILEVNDPTIEAPYIEGRIGLFTKIIAGIWERLIFACSDKIITHNEVMAGRANQKKVRIITNGVDTKIFNPEKYARTKWADKFVCLFIGTFAEWQGTETILKAAELLRKNKKILFAFAGSKGDNEENTEYLGRIKYSEIPQLIANSDVCLYTPDTEHYKPMKKLGFYFSPLKLFEYMSMAKPVIVSDAGNLKKIVKNEVNGYRIGENNGAELASKILKLYRNKKLRTRIGKNNREECEKKYSWTKIAKKVLK